MQRKQAKVKKVKVNQGVKELRTLYDVDRNKIGEGAFGSVFLAQDKHDPNHKVAIKVLNK